jgi:hypothetical protein
MPLIVEPRFAPLARACDIDGNRHFTTSIPPNLANYSGVRATASNLGEKLEHKGVIESGSIALLLKDVQSSMV